MNTTRRLSFDAAEWDAQERGLHAARARAPGELDAAARSYRVVAEALASCPGSEPPADFAAGVAARITRHEAGLERLLSRLLLAALVLASIGAAAVYGGRIWRVLRLGAGDDALGWISAAAACAVASWLFGRLRELAAAAPLRHAR